MALGPLVSDGSCIRINRITGLCLYFAGSQRETNENNEDISSKPNNSVCNLTNLVLPRKRIPKVAFFISYLNLALCMHFKAQQRKNGVV